MELDKKLVALRKKRGMSQAEVSAELGVSRQAISKWEVGDTVPSTGNLKRLSELYGVSLEYLFDKKENNAPENKTDKEDAPVEDTVKKGGNDCGQHWKKLAILMFILCGVLATALIYYRITEKSKDCQRNIPIGEMKEVNVEPSGSFDFEW